MKRVVFVALFVLALFGFVTAIAWAAPPGEGASPNLVPTSISLNPQVPYPGQQVEFTIGYENQGDASVSEGIEAKYRIVVEGNALAEGEVPEAANLEAGGRGEVTGSFYAPVQEDTYALIIYIAADGAENRKTETLVVESALPQGVAQLFAGLGIFAAVMAIMAAGTEVVVESLKFVIGMKQKATAMEAFNQLRQELPGQLAGLGVDEVSLKKVNELFEGLGEKVLEPVTSMVGVYEKIKAGHFGEAFQALKAIEQLSPGTAAAKKEMEKLKEQAKSGVRSGFALLRERLHLNPELTNPIQTFLLGQIDQVTIETATQLTETTVKKLQETVLAHEPEWTGTWLRSQVDTFITHTRDEVIKRVDRDVIQTLHGLGFADDTIAKMKSRLEGTLDSIERVTRNKANTYSLAVQELLGAVEKRRNEMQSPVRKLYRRLRKSNGLTLWAALWWVAFSVAGIILACWPGLLPNTWRLWAAILGISVGTVGGLIVNLILVDKNTCKLGDLLLWIETKFNNLLGRRAQPPERYGEVDVKVEERIKELGPTSVAAVLLEREDKHQDEESSRVRILRVLTIIVGTFLALWLRVDAAEYLNYAVPGIYETINFIELHKLWVVIPKDLTVGMVLTGLAASAGSKFWRDLLGRLQTARGQAEEAAKLVQKVKGMVGVAEEG